MNRRPHIDEKPPFCPHPLSMEVVRRFPAHWLFGGAWWVGEADLCLPLGPVGSIRVMWPLVDHPDAHSWRVMFYTEHPYNMGRFDDLDDLPRVAANKIMAYASRGHDWIERRQRLCSAVHPAWLQVELDRLITPKQRRTEASP